MQETKPYKWYLLRSFKLFAHPPLKLMSDTLNDFKDLMWFAREFGMGIISLLILFFIYLFFPVTFPFVAWWARRSDIKQEEINKKVDKWHDNFKPNPKVKK